jgi:hypothetical protein
MGRGQIGTTQPSETALSRHPSLSDTHAVDSEIFSPETWHPTLKALYDYWISIHPLVGLPGRQHVDPCAFPHLLSRVFMVDVSRNPLRFKYRLVGTEYVYLMGRDLTGRYLDEVHPDFHGLILRQYVEAAERRRPAYRKGPIKYASPHREYFGMERVILPLGHNGFDVDVILGAVMYIPTRQVSDFSGLDQRAPVKDVNRDASVHGTALPDEPHASRSAGPKHRA